MTEISCSNLYRPFSTIVMVLRLEVGYSRGWFQARI